VFIEFKHQRVERASTGHKLTIANETALFEIKSIEQIDAAGFLDFI
jgi:hypothetical protein